jgi:hypothetical protein
MAAMSDPSAKPVLESSVLGDAYEALATGQPDKLDAFWMPFSANRQFKKQPRLLVSAAGMYYKTSEGREILDATGGLWCCNAGHARPRIIEAVSRQIATMDFAPTFQMGHPLPFVWPSGSPRSRRIRSSMCSSPTPARSPWIPHSRSRWPTSARAAKASARA